MKKISVPVKIITIYNILQTLMFVFVLGTSYPDGMYQSVWILFVFVANYFLLLGKKAAWYAMFFWYLALVFNFTTPAFYFDISYGFLMLFDFSIYINKLKITIGIDALSIAILLIHLISKKDFMNVTSTDRVEEIDQIIGNS